MQESADGRSPEGHQDKQAADHALPGRQLVRPSMEARRRRLDLSALQVTSCFLFQCFCCNHVLMRHSFSSLLGS